MQVAKIFISFFIVIYLFSCTEKKSEEDNKVVNVKTPVTVTAIKNGKMEEHIVLNATSSYLQKWIVRANTTGYLQESNLKLNKYVSAGQSLCLIKTKEAESIGNTINILDSTFKFSGINTVKANGSGFISQLNHQKGDYVQDGEQLAVITDTKSFVFLLSVPYELRRYIFNQQSLEMLLPDGQKLMGKVSGTMPSVDSVSQTQTIILTINITTPIPENLIAKVIVTIASKNNTFYLPKDAILTNETQSSFWVMKMTDSFTAVKIPVQKGMETTDRVEILSPHFMPTDKILVSGNYGLADTASVQIIGQVDNP